MIGSINSGNDVDRFSISSRRVELNPGQNEASKARQVALNHISEGTKAIYDKILSRIRLEAAVGRFKLTHSLRDNEAHLKDNIVEKLRSDGFVVSVGNTSQREPEVVFSISW